VVPLDDADMDLNNIELDIDDMWNVAQNMYCYIHRRLLYDPW
jgi:hypothetical protein